MRSAGVLPTPGALSNRLRRLANTLSGSAQAAAMSDFVARFFSTSTAAERAALFAAAPASAGEVTSATTTSVTHSASAKLPTQQPVAAAPGPAASSAAPTASAPSADDWHSGGGDACTTSGAAAPPSRDLAEVEDLYDIRAERARRRAALANAAVPDTRTMLELLDEIVGEQISLQPDEDVITIRVTSDGAGRRLFQYLVCAELWFLPLLGADATSMTDDHWAGVRGAAVAIAALVRPPPLDTGAPPPPQLCIATREDLNVYYMPPWQRGVGCTLESLRRGLRAVPAGALPSADECFSAHPDTDVLSVPFEPSGMRQVLVNGQHELTSMSLNALSDKRQTTEPIDPAPGDIVAGRFRVDRKVGSATFSDAYSVTMITEGGGGGGDGVDGAVDDAGAPVACIKCIKPEFFDQALDEVRLLSAINDAAQQRYDAAIQLLNEYTAAHGDDAPPEDPHALPPAVLDAVRTTSHACGADACHVVRLADAFYFRHRMFVVTELLKENLYETVCASTAVEPYWFDIGRLAIIARQVTTALTVLHGLGLIHCDVKPENIMVQSHSRCQVKLIDFGSSAYMHERFSSYVQSRSYRAPEVIMGAPYDSRVDVWSLGAVLVELACKGEILFRSTTLANLMARVAAVCGPVPASLAHAGGHSDCITTRSGIFFSQSSQMDEERFEKLEQHPYFYTAQAITTRAETRSSADAKRQRRAQAANARGQVDDEVEDVDVDEDEDEDAASSDVSDFESKKEIWLHFPVFPHAAADDGDVANRQDLWKKPRGRAASPAAAGDDDGGNALTRMTNADWVDVYEHNGRIEALLERSGGWDLSAVVHGGAAQVMAAPVVPELLFLDFVKKCLIVEPTQRPTTEALLRHPFLATFAVAEEDMMLRGGGAGGGGGDGGGAGAPSEPLAAAGPDGDDDAW